MPPTENDHKEMKRLIEENAELLKQNNTLLRKLHRNSVIGIVMRVVWYGVLIGLPFALYYFLLEPYFTVFGSDFELFREGISELPGLRGIEILFNQAPE